MVNFGKRLKPRIDLNPSSADRWTTCTASPKYILQNWERVPKEDRTFADPGTTAHEVAAALLQDRAINESACPVPPTAETHWHAFQYADFIHSLREPGGKLFVEQKLPLFYAEGRNAIVDAAVINPNGLHIVDLKYGEGIIVSPENNLQGTIYAKSVIWNWKGEMPNSMIGDFSCPHPDDFPVYVSIYQPRTKGDAPFHTWSTTLGDIRERAKKIFHIAQDILIDADPIKPTAKNLAFAPSDKACQWCPAKGFCEHRQDKPQKKLGQLAVVDGQAKPLGSGLTAHQLAAVVEHGDEMVKWIRDVQGYALSAMQSGILKVPGFKVVKSRGGHRYWTDTQKAAELLLKRTHLRREEVVTEETKSPAQIETLLGKGNFPKDVFNLIAKPDGKPVLAREDDPRQSIAMDITSEFENLDGGAEVDLAQF